MTNSIDFERIYTLLGVDPEDGWEVAQAAYRRRMQQLHPDKLRGLSEDQRDAVMVRFLEVQSGFEQLRRFHRAFGALPPRPVNPAPDPGPRLDGRTEGAPEGEMPTSAGPTAAGRPEATYARRALRPRADAPIRTEAMGTPAPTQRWRRRALIMLVGVALVMSAATLRDDDRGYAHDHQAAPPRKAEAPLPAPASLVRRGSPIGELIDLLGRADEVAGDTWVYGRYSFEIVDGRVLSWRASSRDQLPAGTHEHAGHMTPEAEHEPIRPKFRIGSRKAEVMAIQGAPLRATETRWNYGVSTIYFEDSKVVGWFHSRLDPLRVDGPLGHYGRTDYRPPRD